MKLALALILGLSLSLSAQATERQSKFEQRMAPQMAGVGTYGLPSALRHDCTVTYQSCLTKCKSVSGAACEAECSQDCDVCSLDFGEESAKVCNKR